MRMVKFTKSMSPHGVGDTRVVTDEVADRLIKEGVAEFTPSVFDPPAKKKASYLTRKASTQ